MPAHEPRKPALTRKPSTCSAAAGLSPLVHDAACGKATLDVCLAVLRSAVERREVFLAHQVPTRPGS